MKNSKNKGFTLIEILVVIGIIAILAAVVLIAINPARQFAQARNSQRVSNLNAILNAIGQFTADNKGKALDATTCPGITTAIGTPPFVAPAASTTIGVGTGKTDLASCLVPTYIPGSIPFDPIGSAVDTKYTISVSGGRYTVCAPESKETNLGFTDADIICVTR